MSDMYPARARLLMPTDAPFCTGDFARALVRQYGLTQRSAQTHAIRFCREAHARGELNLTMKYGRRYYTWK